MNLCEACEHLRRQRDYGNFGARTGEAVDLVLAALSRAENNIADNLNFIEQTTAPDDIPETARKF